MDRPTALSLGEKYYDGNPCKICNTTLKITKVRGCYSCQLKRSREYRKTSKGIVSNRKSSKKSASSPASKKRKAVYASQRRHRVGKALVLWADREAISCIYQEAKYLQWHVDHIIPLNHPLVCGLHVEGNLQSLPPEENLRKSNSFVVE